jgi:hypothetical protein
MGNSSGWLMCRVTSSMVTVLLMGIPHLMQTWWQDYCMQIEVPVQVKENSRNFRKNVMLDTGQRGRFAHNEQFAPIYGSVAFENTPNPHAGLCGAKSGR